MKRIPGKKLPLTAGCVHALRAEFTRSIEPALVLAAETLNLERTLIDFVNQAYGLTPTEIDLIWKTTTPRMPIPAPITRSSPGPRTEYPAGSRNTNPYD